MDSHQGDKVAVVCLLHCLDAECRDEVQLEGTWTCIAECAGA